jgi:DNA-binding NarL/FixJ family response regulator
MTSAWPYLERHPVRAGVLDVVRSAREPGVLLVGPYGCGKTYLLRALSEDLQQRGRLLHAAVTTEATVAQAVRSADVLLIDDIDRLDDRALGLLADAATTGDRNLIAATRPLLYPDLALRARGLNLAVTPVPALSEVETRTYCTSRLDGPIDDLSLAEIVEATAGLPLLVREAVDSMLAQQQLRTVHGVWLLDGSVRFSTWLGQAAAASLAPLSPGERDLLQLLAIIDGLPLPLADVLNLHESLERLERRGLLAVPGGDRAVLSPAAAWLPPVVEASGTGIQRRRLATACLRALREPVDHTGLLGPLDTAKLRLAAGRPVDLDHAIAAAGAALEHQAPRWAQRLLHPYAKEPASSPLLADILIRQASPRRAERMLGLSTSIATAESRSRLTACRLDVLVLWLSDVHTAQRVVLPPGCPARPARPDAADVLVASCAENVSSLLPALRKRSENTPLNRPEGQRVFLAHLHALLAGGQAQAALHAVTEIGDTTLGHFVTDLRLAVLLLFGRALLTVSRLPEALGVAQRLTGEGLRLRHGLALAAGLALAGAAHLRHGALDDAERNLRHALAALHGREAGWTQVRAVTGLALCQAWRSGADPSATLDEVRAATHGLGSPEIDEMIGLATAQTLLIRGRIHPAGRQALRVAERAEALGRRATVAEALLIAGQAVPDLDVTRRLTRLADDCDYDLPQVHAGYLAALARRSGAALDASARSYQQRGLRLLAAAACAHAQAHLRTAGEQVTANSSARRLAHLIEETGITVPMAWPPASTLVPLTVREQEVAALVARGLSSEKIAEALRLSVRTVDNHLQHCDRKLGISSRAQLAETLRSGPDAIV